MREAELSKLIDRLILLVDRVRSRNKNTQLLTHPLLTICGRVGCKMDWGDHYAQICPDGKGEFVPSPELVKLGIEKLEEEKQ
jgi:hypothetical protein